MTPNLSMWLTKQCNTAEKILLEVLNQQIYWFGRRRKKMVSRLVIVIHFLYFILFSHWFL